MRTWFQVLYRMPMPANIQLRLYSNSVSAVFISVNLQHEHCYLLTIHLQIFDVIAQQYNLCIVIPRQQISVANHCCWYIPVVLELMGLGGLMFQFTCSD